VPAPRAAVARLLDPATGPTLAFDAKARRRELTPADSAVKRDRGGGNPVERRAHLVQQVVWRHVRVLFGELVAKAHRVFAERYLVGKSPERRVLDMAIAKRGRYSCKQ